MPCMRSNKSDNQEAGARTKRPGRALSTGRRGRLAGSQKGAAPTTRQRGHVMKCNAVNAGAGDEARGRGMARGAVVDRDPREGARPAKRAASQRQWRSSLSNAKANPEIEANSGHIDGRGRAGRRLATWGRRGSRNAGASGLKTPPRLNRVKLVGRGGLGRRVALARVGTKPVVRPSPHLSSFAPAVLQLARYARGHRSGQPGVAGRLQEAAKPGFCPSGSRKNVKDALTNPGPGS